jgi:integrase
VFAEKDINLIRTADIEAYQKKRVVEGHCKPPTINSEVVTLIQLLKYAKKKKQIDDVLECERIYAPPTKPDIPTPLEVEKIIGHLAPGTGLLAIFLAETGCRKNEAFSLEWSDVDFDAAEIAIQRKAEFTPKSAYSKRVIRLVPRLEIGSKMPCCQLFGVQRRPMKSRRCSFFREDLEGSERTCGSRCRLL